MKVLFSPSGKLDLPGLFKAFLIMLFLGVSIESGFQFIPVISKYINYEPNNILAFSDWAKWLLPVLLFIFVQSAAE